MNVILIGDISMTLVVDFCMSSDTVVKHCHVFEDDASSIDSSFKSIVMQTFRVKRAKETYPCALSQAKPSPKPALRASLNPIVFYTFRNRKTHSFYQLARKTSPFRAVI